MSGGKRCLLKETGRIGRVYQHTVIAPNGDFFGLPDSTFRTPYEAINELWKSKPDVFIVKPNHHMLGLNT